jgi:hypothetical protein
MLGRCFRRSRRSTADPGVGPGRGEPHSFLAAIEISLELFAIAVVLFGLAAANRTDGLGFPFLLGGASALLLAIAVAVAAIGPRWKEFFGGSSERGSYEYVHKLGGMSTLPNVVKAGRDSIGTAHPSEEVLIRRLGENRQVLHVYERRRADGRLTFCGYTLVYPLRQEPAEKIRAGNIRSAAELDDGSLVDSFEDAEYLYIGMLLGTDRHSRPHITDELRARLRAILAEGDVREIFARPATASGRRLMERYGFLPIRDPKDIWVVEASSLMAQLSNEDGSP